MEVVLNEDVQKLGYKGDIVNVKRGYFRNFLYPRGLADTATKSRLKVAESRKEKLVMKKQQIVDNAKDVLKKLKGLKLILKAKVSDKGKLYGSITEDDILKELKKEVKLELDKEFIKMEHIKELGEYEVLVHLGEDLEEKINVTVEAEE